MKLKLLVGTMVVMGFLSTSVSADIARVQPTGETTTVASTDLVTFWEGIVNRNEDNANGVVLNQQNHLSGGIATVAGYSAKRGTNLNNSTSPYTNTSPNNQGNTSISLANVELYADSQLSNWARAHVAVAYGPDFTNPTNYGATDMFFTEAYAELNNFQQGAPLWMFAKVGRQYLNFGSTQYNTITEPLTDDLALSNATAITAGVITRDGIYADAYGYNGSPYGIQNSANLANTENTIHGWGAEVGYATGTATQGLNLYADYIANIADSLSFGDNLGAYTASSGVTTWSSLYPDHQRPAYALHANYNTGPFGVIADYVSMIDAFDENIYSYNGHGAKLSAYGLEADYTLPTQNQQMISLGYQGSEDAVQFYGLGNTFSMPKSRIIAGYKYAFSSNVNMKFEYMYDKDYATSDTATSGTGTSALNTYTGSGASNNTVLARLNVMF